MKIDIYVDIYVQCQQGIIRCCIRTTEKLEHLKAVINCQIIMITNYTHKNFLSRVSQTEKPRITTYEQDVCVMSDGTYDCVGYAVTYTWSQAPVSSITINWYWPASCWNEASVLRAGQQTQRTFDWLCFFAMCPTRDAATAWEAMEPALMRIAFKLLLPW